jgi:hypothetical protein
MHENDEAPEVEPTAQPIRKAPAAWAKEKNTPAWQYGGASAGERWNVRNLPITETEYDAAIQKAAGVVCR